MNEVINVNREVVSENTNREINSGIKQGISVIKNELNYNSNLRNSVIRKVVEKKIIDDVELDYDVSDINISNEMSDFLKCQTSKTTKNNYEMWLTEFLKWCKLEKVNCLKITRKEVESYLIHLNNRYSSNSVRSKIMGVCSFYKFLMFRYTKVFLINPFHKLKLPKINLVRRIDIVTDNDVRELKKELGRIGRKDIICVVDLICKYGFRVGIFENMIIDYNGNWSSVSKGVQIKGKFLKTEVKKIIDSEMLSVNKSVITNVVRKYTQKLFDNKVIGCPFSVHDLRHYFITKNGKDLTIEEFVKFSRKIHKNVSTTLSYLNI
jgi:site-specific recombinase XerD